jgi:hypothetical protein
MIGSHRPIIKSKWSRRGGLVEGMVKKSDVNRFFDGEKTWKKETTRRSWSGWEERTVLAER